MKVENSIENMLLLLDAYVHAIKKGGKPRNTINMAGPGIH